MKLPILKRFLRFLRPYWGEEALLLALLLVSSAGSLASPYFLKVIIDRVFPDRDYALLMQVLLLLVGVYLVRIAAAFCSDYLYVRVSTRVVADIRRDLFSRLLLCPLAFYSQNKTGELVHKINGEVDKIQHALTNSVIRLINNVLTIAGLVVMLSLLNFKLFLVSALIFPFIFLNIKYFAPRTRAIYERVSRKEAAIHHFFSERFANIKLIKSHNAYGHESDRLRDSLAELGRLNGQSIVKTSMSKNISVFLVSLGPILVFSWGGLDVLSNSMTLGALVAFLQYLNRLYGPATDLMYLHADLLRTSVSMQQVFRLFEEPVQPNAGTLTGPGQPLREISFQDVHFAHNSQRVAQGLSFTLKAGRVYALVGASGSGKSTLINLLCRFYQPQHGQISVNDTRLDDIDLYAWTGAVTLVSQENYLFHDTIAANIRYNTDATDAEVAEAIRLTGADAIVQQLPDGLRTVIGDQGATLSGGQVQRLAISRALLRKAPVLILDEATSAIDSEGETRILQNLRASGRYQLIILISHRISAIMQADQIICLDKGRVAEQGSHEELAGQKGTYYHLFRHQLPEPVTAPLGNVA